jgi:hypothetical protein
MTVDLTCPSRKTRKVAWPAAGAVGLPAWERRRYYREPRSISVQRVGRVVVDAPVVAAEDASLVTSR